MALTPLDELQLAAHKEFRDSPPSQEELATFLEKRLPRLDGGLAIALAIAALVLQGWQVGREEYDRWQTRRAAAPPKGCPVCGKPEKKKSADGRSECEDGHTW